MGNWTKINDFRRNLMRRITQNIGRTHRDPNHRIIGNGVITKILLLRPNNRLGNLLLLTPLLQEIADTFPYAKIDLFVRGNLAPVLYQNYEQIDRIITLPKKPFEHLVAYLDQWLSLRAKKYDLLINVDKNSASGRLSAQYARSTYKFFGDTDTNIILNNLKEQHLAKYPVSNLRHYLVPLGFVVSRKSIPKLDLRLSAFEIGEGLISLQKLVSNNKKTICIFTYATGAKRYSELWWNIFYTQLKAEYANYNIIEVLPIENKSQIQFIAPTFYSSDIRQIGSLIANTEIFIGADSGMMHLASASQTPTIGLFAVTDQSKYEPYGNDSIGINTNNSTIQDWIAAINLILNRKLLKRQG